MEYFYNHVHDHFVQNFLRERAYTVALSMLLSPHKYCKMYDGKDNFLKMPQVIYTRNNVELTLFSRGINYSHSSMTMGIQFEIHFNGVVNQYSLTLPFRLFHGADIVANSLRAFLEGGEIRIV